MLFGYEQNILFYGIKSFLNPTFFSLVAAWFDKILFPPSTGYSVIRSGALL